MCPHQELALLLVQLPVPLLTLRGAVGSDTAPPAAQVLAVRLLTAKSANTAFHRGESIPSDSCRLCQCALSRTNASPWVLDGANISTGL